MNKILALDRDVTILLNSIAKNDFVRRTFALANYAGDMYLWIACILLLPFLFDQQGKLNAITAVLAIPISVTIQTIIKHTFKRKRPFYTIAEIFQCGHILDKHSFPSGHCLHAIMFSLILGYQLPWIMGLLLLLSVFIFLSRPILGIHYVSDVLAGILFGAGISYIALNSIYPYSQVVLAMI